MELCRRSPSVSSQWFYLILVPYYPSNYEYQGEHEYSIVGVKDNCQRSPNVYLTLTPMNSKKSNASLKVEVTKCAGVFIANGTYEILADSQSKGWTGSYTLGTRSFSKGIVPLSKSLVGQHTYQVKLISSKPGSPIYTGSISVETRGRCWCTDYVKQRFNLRGAVPNGGAFGPYLINNGYRTLTSKESPIAGDVAVFPNDNHVAVYIKKTSTALWFRQGGKATDGWGEENSCYNVHDQDWKLNTYVVYYRR